jgi:hypothetical protein
MIPEFPKFKSVELSDKKDIEKFTSKHPPYSDFNFISMWSWDIRGEMRISELNNNLVVRFTDYISGEPFYSFLGDNKVNETVEALLKLSKKEGLKPVLRLVPEVSLKNIDSQKFKIKEDPDNFDYIYDVPMLASLKGTKYETHRNLINQFKRNNSDWRAVKINVSEILHKNEVISLFTHWVINKNHSLIIQEYKNEFLALNKLLSVEQPEKFNLSCFAIYAKQDLVGFIINEKIGKYNIIHFEKADIGCKGAYPLLMQENLKVLEKEGIECLNFEQDLGIEALRFTKRKFCPSSFLKKYRIEE